MIIRQVNKSDISSVLDLFTISDNKHIRNEEFYYWRNFGNPYSGALSYLIEDNGSIIAHYSILPHKLYIGGKIYTGGLGQQAVVHPHHRNLKNIYDLVKYSLKDALSRGVQFVYGFPNENFYLVSEKILKWDRIDRFHVVIYDFQEVISLYNKTIGKNFYAAENIIRIDKNNYDLYEQAIDKFLLRTTKESVSMVIDPQYIKWRYLNNPLVNYAIFALQKSNEIKGLAVLKLFYNDNELVGHFIDFIAHNKEAERLLFINSLKYFSGTGISKVVLWPKSFLNTDYFAEFNKGEGFITNFYSVNLSMENNIYHKVTNINNWNLNMHYSDAF